MKSYSSHSKFLLSRRHQKSSWGPSILPWLVIAALMLVIGSAFWRSSSDPVVQAVELARDIFGPRPVAQVEEVVFRLEDWYNRLYFQVLGSTPSWQFITPLPKPEAVRNGQAAAVSARPAESSSSWGIASSTGASPASTVNFSPPPAIKPIITASPLPGEGQWRPLATGAQPSGQPSILWYTVLRPDPSHPFAQVGLVAMDLSRSQLHLMIGTAEPAGKRITAAPRPGMLPPKVQASGTLLAAWNGGFRAVHGHYGMMTDGTTWLPPIPGMATLAITRDGRVIIGAWGREVSSRLDLVAWRQNNPPLIENGVINPDVHHTTNTREWGVTIGNNIYTWRTGLGLTQDGRWLIYAVGNSLTTESLTSALQAAGAYNAMQTDINSPYDRFETYTASAQREQWNGQRITLPLTAHRLIDQMKGGSDQYLVPYRRDFFYLTSRAVPAKTSPNRPVASLGQAVTHARKPT